MKALARFLVRWHPKPWRARYEDEVLELLEANRVRGRDLFDLFKSGVTERVLSWYEPSWHIARFRLITTLVITACVVAVSIAMLAVGAGPWAAGYYIGDRFGPVPPVLHEVAVWLQVLLMVPVWICWYRLIKLRHARFASAPSHTPIDIRLVWAAMLGCILVSFLAGVATDVSPPRPVSVIITPLILLLQVFDPSGIRWPGGDLLDALGRHRRTQYDLRWARMELERCEGLYQGREAGPELRAARSEMDRLLREQARALADLDAMSYHARFQS